MNKSIFFMLSLILVLISIYFFNLEADRPADLEISKSQECPKLSGRIITKDDVEYDTDRLVSNYYSSKNKFPQVIVYCQNTKDVQNAVLWARCNKTPVRIRSGGHNHEGYSTGDHAIVIDVSEMKNLEVDSEARTAKIQPGLNNYELYSQLYKKGLTHVGGTCSEVGISGLVLSGGMGPLLRKVGLTCDSLIAVEMVDAFGKIIHATKENEHQDLFWATCGGGGGNFGIITSLEIKIFPAQDVTWFNIGWDWSQPIDEVISAWQDFFSKQDPNWFSHLDLWSKAFPTEKLNKQPVKVLGFFWGSPEEAKNQMKSLLSIGKPAVQTFEWMKWNKAIKLIEESTSVFLTKKPEYKSSGAFVKKGLPPKAIDILYNTLKASNSPLFNVLLFSMGGATAEIEPSKTAYFYRDADFFINYTIQWLAEGEDKKQKSELAQLRRSLIPFTEGNYIGNPDPDLKNYLKIYYGENVKKLKCIKKKYDPENFFRFELSIPPIADDRECS